MSRAFLGKLTFELREQAKAFRKNHTSAERILWKEVRNRKLGGHKFKRQVVIDQFIVDFYCAAANLIVEIDGEIHKSQKEHDRARNEVLAGLGFRVIRFRNQQVFREIEKVKEELLRALKDPSPRRPAASAPLPRAGEGTGERG
ncbi:MAG: DUF559 domain-containing protein [Anaerolineales bacterium]